MRMYRDSKTADRIKATLGFTERAVKPKKHPVVKSGNKFVDQANNPKSTMRQLNKELRSKK